MATRGLGWALLPVFLCGAIGIGAAIVLAGSGGSVDIPGTPVATANRFDGARAHALVARQVAHGQRPAGSAASRRLAAWLRTQLPGGRFEQVPGGLRNIVGTLPGSRPAIVVSAHYDTKVLPGERGFQGANDGAAGTAVVLELARVLRTIRRPAGAPELRFVLFDGEESPDDDADFYATGLRGSKAYARRHARDLGAVVNVDFVGQRGLRLEREQGSDPAAWERLRDAAARVGVVRVFPGKTRSEILDDHTPFARAGVTAIDLIDFDYACFHDSCDRLDQVEEPSLDATGEALVELLRQKTPIRFGGQ
ncbi:M28 family metallopeptidase [Conexibacter sp. JD483]|uniref:M28 family metallopeptidase n=1 Tax=unclassified Conexibacter TaxID=2627773 RepID=UPI00271C7DCF|nr:MULTISPECIES: M28 family metallopeptidase [unclassified Conexibacter]MDO8188047.1 M28 family metallopeptidase [Conexibacter sp. CPCC 205706]MDO8200469.1 M28 family metallopeptidase [Conexibacter sp. CPCC 205762]MDR9369816.1 M28 family metallopeptidase [Conexibacter sp. JD483]